ncbi:MAG: hypothetical protein ACE5GN_03990 [Waddliaceae bacterium]
MSKILMIFAALSLGVQLGANAEDTPHGALLQTQIQATPLQSPSTEPGKVQPRTRMELSAKVKNVGDEPNVPGTIYVRFAFPKPLDQQPTSVIFETETVELPSIMPGGTVSIDFSTPHQWPSLFDFIRHDWTMREYEAVVVVGGVEQVTGTRAIAFSAHYYEGHSQEKPAKVASL